MGELARHGLSSVGTNFCSEKILEVIEVTVAHQGVQGESRKTPAVGNAHGCMTQKIIRATAQHFPHLETIENNGLIYTQLKEPFTETKSPITRPNICQLKKRPRNGLQR